VAVLAGVVVVMRLGFSAPGNAGDGERPVAAADAALYSAKREGRDRSVGSNRVAEPGEEPHHPVLRRGAGAPESSSKGS
jgi:hypothetical protein